MSGLAEFLIARIAEDEAAARDAAGWDRSGRERASGRWRRDGRNSVEDEDHRLVVFGDGSAPGPEQVEHIARWDPARVLAECAAKRRIVELRQGAAEFVPLRRPGTVMPHELSRAAAASLPALDETLRLLALPYADHEQFQEEWRV